MLSQEPTDTSVSMGKALSGLPAYSSERGSLLTMQALLYGISALVTIAFLSIWTIQRTRDLSIGTILARLAALHVVNDCLLYTSDAADDCCRV